MCADALAREESCGCHFRVEHRTERGEGRRDDAAFAHVALWHAAADGAAAVRTVEPLVFSALAPAPRSSRELNRLRGSLVTSQTSWAKARGACRLPQP